MNPVTLMSFRSEMQRIAYASLADGLEKTAYSPRKVLEIFAKEGVEGIARFSKTPEGRLAVTRTLKDAPDMATIRGLLEGRRRSLPPDPVIVRRPGETADQAAYRTMKESITLRERMAPAIVAAATKAEQKLGPKAVDFGISATEDLADLGYRAANTTMAVAANPGVQSLMRNPNLGTVFADASSASGLIDAASGLADIVPDIAKMVKSAPKTVKPSIGIKPVKPSAGFKAPKPPASMKPASPAKPLKIKPVVAPKMKLPVPSSTTPAAPSF